MAAASVSHIDKLKRILYLSNDYSGYFTGDQETHHLSKLDQEYFDEVLKSCMKKLLKTIVIVSEDELLPRRANLYFVLAKALNSSHSGPLKSEITATVLKLCKSDAEFFDFIKYYSQARKGKLSTSSRKCIKQFYKNKSPSELANSYATYKSYHGWSHKDLIKLAHLKSDSPLKNVVVNYILLNKTNSDDPEAKKLIEILEKSEELRCTTEVGTAVPIINELKATINQISTKLHKSPEVWNAVLPHMSVSEVLHVLPKLYKLGLLKANTPTQSKVIEVITSSDKIKVSKLHPVEVFIHMKNFEKGGKPLDPKLIEHLVKEKKLSEEELKKIVTPNEPKCPVITNSIQKCLNMSYSNLTPLGKRFLITIESSEKQDLPCLHNKNITAMEAALAITLSILKVEKDVTVATFHEREIRVINLDKNSPFQENLQKLRDCKSAYLLPYSAIEWANSKKKHIDIFINFVHCADFSGRIPKEVRTEKWPQKSGDILSKYRKKVNLPNTKMVTFCLPYSNLVLGQGAASTLDILGLSPEVPRVLEAFCRGNFS